MSSREEELKNSYVTRHSNPISLLTIDGHSLGEKDEFILFLWRLVSGLENTDFAIGQETI